jgi:hypothetical protein
MSLNISVDGIRWVTVSDGYFRDQDAGATASTADARLSFIRGKTVSDQSGKEPVSLEAIEVSAPTVAAHAGNNARLAAWLHGSAVPKTFRIIVGGDAKTVVLNVSHRPA